jgi:parallel beta-helix repeat protein
MVNRLKNALWLIVGAVVAVWAVTSLVGVVQGGPMNPPGPPGETTIPLNDIRGSTPLYPEDMPYNLNHSGSYYLTGDWHLDAPGTDAITISADNVTLDLNGFALIGPGKGVGSDDGVYVECGTEIVPELCYNISIYNGTVRDWGGSGVNAFFSASSEFANLRLSNNGDAGLVAEWGTVTDSVASGNDGFGFRVAYSTVLGSYASSNGGDGFIGSWLVLTDCFSYGNLGDGIAVGESTVSNCETGTNEGNGIRVTSDSLVAGNVAENNTGAGIHVTGANNRIEGNNATNNDIGIDVDAGGNLIIKNSASGNTSGYHFAANNTYGKIISGPGEIAADPWANFDY